MTADAKSLAELGEKWINRIREADKREERWFKSAEKAENQYTCGKTEADAPAFNLVHSNLETIIPAIYNSPGKPDIRPAHNNGDPTLKEVSRIFERAITAFIDDNRMDKEMEAGAQDSFLAGRGVVRVKFDANISGEAVSGETVSYEVVPWRCYREGPATRESEVPWKAFRHSLSKDGLEEFADDGYIKLQEKGAAVTEEGDINIWEIWCKATKKVYFIADVTGRVLKPPIDDPLGLPGFYPCHEPMVPISATGSRVPVCPYEVYRSLAEEANTITERITALVAGLKARGLGVASVSDLAKLADASDNEIVTASDLEGLAATRGIENAILWWPIDKQVAVVRELFAQREQVKQMIYEITGISDIVRGQSSASETATAQQIKTEWGSLRIKKMQRMVERAVRDLFVITTHIIATKFSPETLMKLTGLQVPDGVLGKALEGFIINVESDSTVRADRSKSREEMAAFLQGTAQFFSAVAPIAQQAPGSVEALATMYGSFARQFNLGKEAEDALDQLSQMAQEAAKNPQPNPEAEAAKADMALKQQQMQADVQTKQAELQIKTQEGQANVQLKQVELQLKQAELQLKAQEQSARQAESMGKLQLDQQKLQNEGRNAELENRRTALDERRLEREDFHMNEDEEHKRGVIAAEVMAGQGVIAEALKAPLTAMQAQLEAGQAQIAQGNEMIAQMLAQMQATSQAQTLAMVAAMTAPKEIIKDADGHPVGVRTVNG